MSAPAVMQPDDATTARGAVFVPVTAVRAAAEPTRQVAAASPLIAAIAAAQIVWLALLAFGLYALAT